MIELIGTLVLAASPWLLKMTMNLVKKATLFEVTEGRKPTLRFILAVLSFGAVIIHTILSGGEVPQTDIELFVAALTVFIEWLFVWLSTTALYLLKKKAS